MAFMTANMHAFRPVLTIAQYHSLVADIDFYHDNNAKTIAICDRVLAIVGRAERDEQQVFTWAEKVLRGYNEAYRWIGLRRPDILTMDILDIQYYVAVFVKCLHMETNPCDVMFFEPELLDPYLPHQMRQENYVPTLQQINLLHAFLRMQNNQVGIAAEIDHEAMVNNLLAEPLFGDQVLEIPAVAAEEADTESLPDTEPYASDLDIEVPDDEQRWELSDDDMPPLARQQPRRQL